LICYTCRDVRWEEIRKITGWALPLIKVRRVPSPAENETTVCESFGKRKTMKNEKIDRC